MFTPTNSIDFYTQLCGTLSNYYYYYYRKNIQILNFSIHFRKNISLDQPVIYNIYFSVLYSLTVYITVYIIFTYCIH